MESTELFTARDALLKLLEVRGDFRLESSVRGASLLALAAVHASHVQTINALDRVAILTEAHRNLFNAK